MALWLAPLAARGADPNKVKIGVLTDMAGPVSDVAGPGSVAAARLAVEEHAKSLLGDVEVEIVQGDHQNKTDVAASIAGRWIEAEGVNVIVDVPFSAAALAVHEARAQKWSGGAPRLRGRHGRAHRPEVFAKYCSLDL